MIANVTLFSCEYRGSSTKTMDTLLIHFKVGALRYLKNNAIGCDSDAFSLVTLPPFVLLQALLVLSVPHAPRDNFCWK